MAWYNYNPFTEIKRHIALYQMAKFFSHIDRNPVTRTPEEVGLTFEDISFKTEDGVNLKAWYLPCEGGSKKLIVFNHFMVGNRAGGGPPDPACWGNVTVDFMPIYKALVEGGYSVFTYDIRNHGESDVFNGDALGLTHTEYKDALAAQRYVNEHYRGTSTDSATPLLLL
jgi:dipeptidyl aminopeptidase/acylaminoacyl peptidase